jgi:predicted dehydrogenase
MACRWGILSTANIANKNVRAIQALPVDIAQVVAVGSRTLDRAQEFAKKYNILKVYGSYDELLNDPEIDAVYIPLPTALHVEWVKKAAAKGKHVLCDKPVGVNLSEVKEMVEAITTHNVEFMDGVMFMHHKRMKELHDKLHDKEKFGEIRTINAGFHFFASDDWSAQNIRLKPDLEPLGAFGDVSLISLFSSLLCSLFSACSTLPFFLLFSYQPNMFVFDS